MKRAQSVRLVLLVAVLVAGLVLWWVSPSDSGASPVSSGPGASSSTAIPTTNSRPTNSRPTNSRPTESRTTGVSSDLRAKALAVLDVVDSVGKPPAGYVGGRQFMNDGRGGTALLPRRAADGRVVIYHEYDVNPFRQGVDRGPQRLVVGDDGSAWCTGDHYVTWIRLR